MRTTQMSVYDPDLGWGDAVTYDFGGKNPVGASRYTLEFGSVFSAGEAIPLTATDEVSWTDQYVAMARLGAPQ
jgi:hypothetical protein